MLERLKRKLLKIKEKQAFDKLQSEYDQKIFPPVDAERNDLTFDIEKSNTTIPRLIDPSDLLKINNWKEAVVTTYFILKKDPQFGIVRRNADIEYLKPWHSSILKHKINGVIIHDGLDEEFINKYENEHLKFVKFNYGNYSIFEERWIGYYLLLKNSGLEKAFFTDCNDVYITANPFLKLEIRPDTLYVGRDQANRFEDSGWIIDELNRFVEESNLEVPETLYHQPLFNAGVVGGNANLLKVYINEIIGLVFKAHTDYHKDMTLVNWAIHSLFKVPLKNKGESIYIDPNYDYAKDCDRIVSGYPLNSPFKGFELDSDAIFIHK